LFECVLKLFGISDHTEIKFSVGFDFTGTIKVVLIIANFY